MKKCTNLLLILLVLIVACNNTDKTPTSISQKSVSDSEKYPNVQATINGALWKSVPSEILAKHSSFDDKLQIFTKDEKGKMNFLITLDKFGTTQIGNYSSVKEGVGGYGISLLDDNMQDDEANDFDNFRQGATPNCITVTNIKNVNDGKIVTGTFNSSMNPSNNYDAAKSKSIQVTDGHFSVLISK
jgi:hypothetical protein